MPAIVTVTFSPCIDKSTSVSHLLPEKKLKCAYPKLEPGGGGINVSRAIKKLGGESLAVFPAGGYAGQYFLELLRKENITCSVVEVANETRENIIVYDESSGQQYRFGMPGNPLSDSECRQLLQAVENVTDAKFIVASGSLPPGVPADILAQLARIAKSKNAKFVADSAGEGIRHAMKEGVFLVKPNLGELAFLTGKEHLEIGEVEKMAKELVRSGASKIVVVSLGKEGALLVAEAICERIIPPSVESKSTVGAGDSMVAGIVFSLLQGKDLKTSVQFGVACGTAATMNAGTELCHPEDVNRLFNLISGVGH